MADKTARLSIAGVARPIDLPVLHGTVGPDVIDIAQLAAAGLFTYDPGFVSTASCESAITYIDGDAGVLLYRGYPIEQLAEESDYLEVCYLLLNGELPDRSAEGRLRPHDHEPHDGARTTARLFDGFRRDAHPMAIMCGVTGALSAFYHDSLDIDNPDASQDHGAPPDCKDADARGDELQIFDRPAVHVSAQRSAATRRTSCR